MEEQFGSLARHLLAVYEVPSFLDAAWRAGLTAEGLTRQGWFKLIGRGQNIRTADDLPIPLTKRMAHHFLLAPPGFDIPAAFRYAQILGLGGDERLARSLLGTRIAADFRDNEFWEAVIRWFIAHPTLAPMHHAPIIDYLHNQKFVPSAPNPSSRVRGRPRRPVLVPPQPNLCMKGRTPGSLLRAVEEWHKRLGLERKGAGVEWKPSGIKPFALEHGQGIDRKFYAITELISSEELAEEGRAMEHCVADYWMMCASGQSSIWSLTFEDAPGQVTRLLTLQVRNDLREIIQARRRANHPASREERFILGCWADAGGPSPGRWCMDDPPDEP